MPHMTDEAKLVADLERLANEHEAKARQLRQAAAIVRGESSDLSASSTDVERSTPQVMPDPDAGLVKPTREDYVSVIQERGPRTNWNADLLRQAMRKRGFSVNLEAARTMLYRLENHGVIEKHGRGTWRLRDASADTRTGPAEAGPVQVLRSTPWGGDRDASVG